MDKNPTAVSEKAQIPKEEPVVQAPPAPAPRELEKKEGTRTYYTRIYPRVNGGICEKCGVIDKNQPAIYQYKLCEHYRGLSLECSYCDPTRDPDEVVRISSLKIYDHPTKKDAQGRPVLGVVCDSYDCTARFNSEFGN